MRNSRPIFSRLFSIKNAPHAIRLFITAICALALFVVFNGPVEAFSFQQGQPFAYQHESNVAGAFGTGAGAVPIDQKNEADGFDQGVELSSPVSADSKAIADKVSNESTYETEYKVFCQTHCRLLINLVCGLSGFAFAVLLGFLRTYF